VAERRFDAASSVRHISYAVPLIESVRDRAAAVVHIAPTQLVPSAGPVRELIDQIARELGEPEHLDGTDRELALWLEARLRFLPNPSPVHVRDSLRRLTEAAELGLEDTAAGRELLVVLLRETMMGGATTAAEVARIGAQVLDREPAVPTHVHTALPLLVLGLCAADSLTQVEGWLALALERARGQKLSVEQGLIRAEQALVLVHCGRTEEARRAAFDAIDMVVLDWGGATTTAAGCLAGVALELREAELAARIVELWPRDDEDTYENALCRVLNGAVLESDPERALEFLKDSGRVLDRGGWRNPVMFPWRLPAALLTARAGDLDAALDLANDARTQALEWGAPNGIGRALRVLGQLTPGRAGADLLRESVSVLEESANQLELAKALLRLGTRMREEGHPSAVEHLGRARELARVTGAGWLLARTGGEAELARATVALTRAEQRVAVLAAAGRTNQEIADQLQVTSRAVEKHLTSCFRKLRIRGRSQLADALDPAV
jgi:DNA-binding CsgD family transcriptional regulator